MSRYRQWQSALFSAVAELEADEAREAAEEAASSVGRSGMRSRKTAAQREHDEAEARRRARAERARREREVAEAAELEARRRKEERARQKREAEEAWQRARVEAEEEAARRRARAKANAEAAEAFVARAATAEEPAHAVRLLHKAVGLRPWSVRYHLLLMKAQAETALVDASCSLRDGWDARNGLRGYAGALLTIALVTLFMNWLLTSIAGGLMSRFCATQTRTSTLPVKELCALGKWADARMRRVRAARLADLLALGRRAARLP